MKKKIIFGDVRIQKLNRIAIPKALLDNLNLDMGDELEIFLDTENDEIIIKPKQRGKKK